MAIQKNNLCYIKKKDARASYSNAILTKSLFLNLSVIVLMSNILIMKNVGLDQKIHYSTVSS